jgi:hypothetical protein
MAYVCGHFTASRPYIPLLGASSSSSSPAICRVFLPLKPISVVARKILLHGLPNNGVLRLDARCVAVRRAW